MKKSKSFRQLQQLVMTKQRRGLNLKSSLEIKMADYIEQSQSNREQLDEIALEIENELLGENEDD